MLRIHAYQLPLLNPWRTAHGIIRHRCGWLVAADDGQMCGFGDCAPLPEAGTEQPAAAQARLMQWCAQAQTLDIASLLACLALALPTATPAADAAVETALLDLAARQARLPLRQWLTAQTADQIAVNAALGVLDGGALQRLHHSRHQGYQVFKFKVGVLELATERQQLRALLMALSPGQQLRLDANQAWDWATARQFLTAIAALPGAPEGIDALEEPLRQPTVATLAALQAHTAIPLAMDESLAGQWADCDIANLPVRRLVLKPGVIGGLRPTLALAQQALAAGIEPVLTSLVESAAGLWAQAQLAAALPCALTHGLATATWLAADLGAPPLPQNGVIRLPAESGSGFVFNSGNLASSQLAKI